MIPLVRPHGHTTSVGTVSGKLERNRRRASAVTMAFRAEWPSGLSEGELGKEECVKSRERRRGEERRRPIVPAGSAPLWARSKPPENQNLRGLPNGLRIPRRFPGTLCSGHVQARARLCHQTEQDCSCQPNLSKKMHVLCSD